MQDTRSSTVSANSAAFEIHAPPSITITSPTSGDIWTKGGSYSLEWTSTGSVSSVNVVMSRTGSPNTIFSALNEANDGLLTISSSDMSTWTSASGYSFRIEFAGTGGTVAVTSDTFTVADADSVTVSNIGSSGCTINVACPISFSKAGTVSAVKIKYRSGTTVGLIVASTSNSPFSWTPTDVTPGDYEIRVEDASKSTTHATTSTFTIHPAPLLTLVQPDSGSVWTQGTSAPVVWTSIGAVGSSLTFTLKKSGSADVVIASGESNDGVLTLSGGAIASIKAGSGYSLLVSDGNGNEDTSTGTFQVNVADGVVVNSPVSGTICVKGSSCIVSWSTTGTLTSVNLIYSGASSGVIKMGATTSPLHGQYQQTW